MFRFFRQIRQKLFAEGKVSKYLGYALGEIVLIMVRLFLASWISECHGGRLKRKSIYNY